MPASIAGAALRTCFLFTVTLLLGCNDGSSKDPSTKASLRLISEAAYQDIHLPSESPILSANGAVVAFSSESDVYVRDIDRNTVRAISASRDGVLVKDLPREGAYFYSRPESVSADGRRVLFESNAPDLAPGYSADQSGQVFLWDADSGLTYWLGSQDSWQAASLSPDGQTIAYSAREGSAIYLRQLPSGPITPLAHDGGPLLGDPLRFTSDGTHLLLRAERALLLYDLASERVIEVSLDETDSPISAFRPSLSADGRFVAFESDDYSYKSDVYVRDTVEGTTMLVSVDATGAGPGNGSSFSPVITADGSQVAFLSRANDLLEQPIEGSDDAPARVYLHDLLVGRTTLVSRSATGLPVAVTEVPYSSITFAVPPIMSADGRRIGFVTAATGIAADVIDDNADSDLYLYDTIEDSFTLASVDRTGKASSVTTSNPYTPNYLTGMSDDGSIVAFRSHAPDVVAEQEDGNGDADIFVRNLATRQTTIAGPRTTGPAAGNDSSQCGTLSGDSIVYDSAAQNLVEGVHDINSLSTLSDHPAPTECYPFCAPCFAGTDVFVRDLARDRSELISIDPTGQTTGNDDSCNGQISADGRYVAFISNATNLIASEVAVPSPGGAVFLRDRKHRITHRVSAPITAYGGHIGSFRLTADGRVVFYDLGSELEPSTPPRVYAYEVDTQRTSIVSINPEGDVIPARLSAITPDGRHIAFVGSDSVVYLRNLSEGTTRIASIGLDGTTVHGGGACLSDDGLLVAFASYSNSGVDTNGDTDIYVRDLRDDTTLLASRTIDGSAAGASYYVCYPGSDCLSYAYFPDSCANRTVVFRSPSGALAMPGIDENEQADTYAFAVDDNSVSLLSADSQGKASGDAVQLSPDGRWVYGSRLTDRTTGASYEIGSSACGIADSGDRLLLNDSAPLTAGTTFLNEVSNLFVLDLEDAVAACGSGCSSLIAAVATDSTSTTSHR